MTHVQSINSTICKICICANRNLYDESFSPVNSHTDPNHYTPQVEGNVGYHACTNRLSSYDVQLGDPQMGRRKRAADLNSSGDDGGFNLEVSVQLDKQGTIS